MSTIFHSSSPRYPDVFSYLKLLLQPGFRSFSVFFIITFSILIYLGTWQVLRLEQKNILISNVDKALSEKPRPLDEVMNNIMEKKQNANYKPVIIKGVFEKNTHLKWLMQTHDGKLGYHYMALLKCNFGGVVLVDLGWVPMENDPRAIKLPQKEITFAGILKTISGRTPYTPDNLYGKNEIFDVDPLEIAGAKKWPTLLPFYVSHVTEGLSFEKFPHQEPFVVRIRNQHLGYIFTWYSLAIAWVFCFIFYMRRRLNDQNKSIFYK